VRWLVDGNNVMGTRPDGWWRDRPGAQKRLLERLEAWAEAEGADATVIFDGRPVDVEPGGVEVAWAARRGPDAADDVIAARAAPGTRVVTSDAALAARARARGAEVEGAGAFLRRLAWV
jgi:predicted RNA-binding protein with PIN domain